MYNVKGILRGGGGGGGVGTLWKYYRTGLETINSISLFFLRAGDQWIEETAPFKRSRLAARRISNLYINRDTDPHQLDQEKLGSE